MDGTSFGVDNLRNAVYGRDKMNLKIYDNVELKTELEELAAKGIHKGCTGLIFDIQADNCFVYFRNDKNYGDYACVNISKKYLDFWIEEPEENIINWERFKAGNKFKTEFKINPFNEFDWVEMLVEKEEYAEKGLHKGMLANVLFDYAIDDRLPVMYPDDNCCDVEVSVLIDDIKLHKRIKKG